MHVEPVDAESRVTAVWAAFERAGTGLAFVDGRGRIVRCNEAFERLHHTQPGALKGTQVAALHPGYNPYSDPAAALVLTDPTEEFLFRWAPGEGSTVIRYRLKALGTGEGGERSAGGEELLLEAWSEASAPALNGGPIPEAVLDADSIVVCANTAMVALFGRGDSLIGERLTHLAHPDDVVELRRLAQVPLRSQQTVSTTVRFSLVDGSMRWLRLSASDDQWSIRRITAFDETRQRQDELLLRETFESAPRPFVMVDSTGRLLGANPAWQRRFSPATGLPADLAGILDGQGSTDLLGQLERASQRIVGWFDVHALATDTDGQPVAVCLSGTALHHLDGRLEQVLVGFLDETERALEVELSRNNATQTRQLLDQLDAAVVVHDHEGHITEINLGAHRLFGSIATDLLGRKGLPRWWNPTDVHGRSVASNDQPAARLSQGGLAQAQQMLSIQLPGEPTRWFAISARPLLAAGIAQAGALTCYFDVTDFQERAAAATARERGAEASFSALPIAAYITDDKFVITRTTAAWDRLLGQPGVHPGLLSLAEPADRHLLAEAAAHVEREGTAAQVQHRVRRPNGSLSWVQHRLAPRGATEESLVGGLDAQGGYCGVIIQIPGWVANSEHTKRLVQLVETTNDLVAEYNLTSDQITYLNPRARELLGVDDDLSELNVWALYLPEVKAIFATQVWPTLRREGRWEGELPMRGNDGSVVSVQHSVSVEREGERIVGLFVTGQNMTARSHRDQELALAATHDSLTGLANRRLILEHLDGALLQARRNHHLVALVITDLDRFKAVNDALGAQGGDEILRAVADLLHGAARPTDLVGRLGGDEFAVVREAVEGRDQALALAAKVVETISNTASSGVLQRLELRASVGVALSDGTDHAEAVLRDAEAALYRAKEYGGGRVELFDETMRNLASTQGRLAEELRDAVTQGEIVVHYQPCIDLRTGQVRSVEALVRWRHPERGLLPPGEFIDVADASGLVASLGQEVLRHACRRASQWRRRWGAGAPRINVNLSIRQLADPNLVDQVAAVLADSGLAPEALCLELVESTLLDDAEESIGVVKALKGLGIGLAIDDFGTGYSSLSYLSRLPVDLVKVDKSFVDQLDPDGDGSVVAAAIVSLAHALGLSTIAEGVTTVAQLAELHRIGCDAAQGYYFSEPLTSEDIDTYLAGRLAGANADAAEDRPT